MIPLIIIRPQPGAAATATAAAELGLDARVFPLFAIEPVAWEPPLAQEVDALLIGSANALRHGGPALVRFRGKPAYAVGQITAGACREAGLTVALTGNGGLDGVLQNIPTILGLSEGRPVRMLRLAGREHIPLRPPPGVELVERIVYASEPRPIPPALADLLRTPAIVLLHSAGAGRHFAGECDRLGLDRAEITLVAIGPRVTAACGSGWAGVATAAAPNDAALLAQVRHLCQNPGGTLTGAD